MGRIKSLMVKKAAKQLLEKQVETFTDSFEHNKRAIRGLMQSKPIQNKIAGYIGRLVKMKRIEKALEDKKLAGTAPKAFQ